MPGRNDYCWQRKCRQEHNNNRRCRKVRDSERDMCLTIDVIKVEADRESLAQIAFTVTTSRSTSYN